MSENLYAPPRPWPCDMQRIPQDIERESWQERGIWHDTYPTAPAHLDGAHACSDIGQDDDTPIGEGAGVLLWPMAVIAACGCWALFAFLTSSPL